MDKKIVVFDCDGVLVDFMLPHLDFCKDMNSKYMQGLELPKDSNEMRDMLRECEKFTPMDTLLDVFGFDKKLIPKMIDEYKNGFAQKYSVSLYDDVEGMFQKLSAQNLLAVGLITANNITNVMIQLERIWNYFTQGCIFTQEDQGSKTDHLQKIIGLNNVDSSNVFYVGDTYKDRGDVLQVEGVNFIASGYGWQFDISDRKSSNFPIAQNVRELEKILIKESN